MGRNIRALPGLSLNLCRLGSKFVVMPVGNEKFTGLVLETSLGIEAIILGQAAVLQVDPINYALNLYTSKIECHFWRLFRTFSGKYVSYWSLPQRIDHFDVIKIVFITYIVTLVFNIGLLS